MCESVAKVVVEKITFQKAFSTFNAFGMLNAIQWELDRTISVSIPSVQYLRNNTS